MPILTQPPERTTGKHPNHALAAVYKLLEKINLAERNLWIEPVELPQVPRQVINPGQIYDALQIVLAELQRIKYRLGVERYFLTPAVEVGKTPDDVIQNIAWATQLLPNFSLDQKLFQYNPQSLGKTPNHVFAVTEHILKELRRYRNIRGIHTIPHTVPYVSGLQPKHVFQKVLECKEDINRLRIQIHLGSAALPRHICRFPLLE